MTMKRWDGAAFVDLTTAKRWTGSAWVDLTIAKRWDGAVWVDIALPGGGGPPPGSPVNVTVSPGSASRTTSDNDPICPTWFTNVVTATALGGTGPYTYLWTRVSGSSSVQVSVPTSPVTDFFASICHGVKAATFRCTAIDSLGAVGFTDIAVSV